MPNSSDVGFYFASMRRTKRFVRVWAKKIVWIYGKSVWILAIGGSAAFGQIEVDTTLDVEELVRHYLVGENVIVRNIRFSGHPTSIGYFKDEAMITGLKSGILLSTGRAADAITRNESPWTTTRFSPMGNPKQVKGDRDLNRISKSVSYDVCIVEFDFVPLHNKLQITYVFGSEEYPEYAESRYNDAFAFIVSGEKFPSVNIATVPRTLLPVTVNNIHRKKNEMFYIDNDYFKKVDLKKNVPGKTKKKDKNPYSDYYEIDKRKLRKLPAERVNSIQFDGLTTVLTASCYLIPYRKYHMKIAIGDIADPQYDSGIFLAQSSLRSVRDQLQPRFKDYPDLSQTIDWDSLFGIKQPATAIAQDSLARAQAEYERFTITHIHFDTDKYVIPDTSLDELRALAEYLNRHPQFICELYGYTDNRGTRRYNQRLSENRANAVYQFLVKQNVHPDRLRIMGLNFQNPIADNREEWGRALNRRVEIVLIEQ